MNSYAYYKCRGKSFFYRNKTLQALRRALFIVVLVPVFLMAQTEWRERPIAIDSATQKNQHIAQPSNSQYTVTVWEDYNDPLGYGFIYAQCIDNANGIAKWTLDGVRVSGVDPNLRQQRNPRAAFDMAGGVIITWEDFRNDTWGNFDPNYSDAEIMAQRIDLATGQLTWGYGVVVRAAIAGGCNLTRNPRIVSADDAVYICWTDYRNSSCYPDYINTDIFAQCLISATGAIRGGGNWIQDGIPVSLDSANERHAEICNDSIRPTIYEGCIIAYESGRNGYWQIFANRLDYLGAQPWGYDLDVATPSPPYYNPPDQLNVKIAQVPREPFGDAPGPVLCWEDSRNYNVSDIDIYAQRIDPYNGVVYWGTPREGIQVCNDASYQGEPRIDAGWCSGRTDRYAVIAWEDGRLVLGGIPSSIFANRVDAITGTLYSAGGDPICVLPGNQHHICIEIDKDLLGGSLGLATIGWQNDDTYPWSNIYAQEVYTNLWPNFQWPTDGIAVTKATGIQANPDVGHRVFVFTDGRRMAIPFDLQQDLNIYAEKFGDPYCDESMNMHYKDQIANWAYGTVAQKQRFSVDVDGNAYVIWQEDRNIPILGVSEPGIYIQKFDKRGVPRWKNGGMCISGVSQTATNPDVCTDGIGGAFAIWDDNGSVIIQRILASGAIMYTSTVAGFGTPVGNSSNPRIIEEGGAGTGVYLSFDHLTGAVYNAYIGYMNAAGAGNVTSPFGGITPTKSPIIANNRTGGCYFVCEALNGDIKFSLHPPALAPSQTGTIPIALRPGFIIDPDYDIATDKLLNNDLYQSTYDLLLAYSSDRTTPPTYDVFVYKIRQTALGTLTPYGGNSTTSLLPLGLNAPAHTRPAIDWDSLSVPWLQNGLPQGGGVIIAWNCAHINANNQLVNQVLTERVTWQGPNALDWPMRRVGPNNWPVSLSDNNTFITHPDIAYIERTAPYFNMMGVRSHYGMVVWEDDASDWCSLPHALVAQSVDYNLKDSVPLQPMQWLAPFGREISPNLGGNRQKNGLIRRSQQDFGEVFWLDQRTGTPSVDGTRIFSTVNPSTIGWVKAGGEEQINTIPNGLSLSQCYPNPLSLSEGMPPSITFSIEKESYVSLKLFDLLGRESMTIFEGSATEGSHTLQITQANVQHHLAPGFYTFTLQSNGSLLTRTMVVVK